jgi:hypothetical protein
MDWFSKLMNWFDEHGGLALLMPFVFILGLALSTGWLLFLDWVSSIYK